MTLDVVTIVTYTKCSWGLYIHSAYSRIGMLCGIYSYAIMRILAKSQN